MLFLLSLTCYETAYFQYASWQEDHREAFRDTSGWIPGRTYSPEVERGLSVLSRSDPAKVAYLRSRGIPVRVLTPKQMGLAGCSPAALGCTRLETSTVNLLSRAVNSPQSLAVVLSHELTHCQRHDAFHPAAPSPLLGRLLWRNEEAAAHVAGLDTANRLGVPYLRGPLAGWWIEYLFWWWPAATIVLSGLLSLLAAYRFFWEAKRQAARRRLRQSQFQSLRPTGTPVHGAAA